MTQQQKDKIHTQALIFDLDGTLWDTVEACTKGWNQALKQLQLPYAEASPQDLSRCMGKTADEIRLMLLPDLSEEQGTQVLAECFQEELAAIHKLGGHLYPGVNELLPQLAKRYPLYLVSNCDPPYLDAFRQSMPISSVFRDMECHGATGLNKGENICLIMSRNQLQSAVYIGDTIGDQEGAAFASIPFVYATYGFGEANQFQAKIETFSELLNLF